jgi:RHH-type transcriptional regulator, rel operon repressor / antitoxin RelB
MANEKLTKVTGELVRCSTNGRVPNHHQRFHIILVDLRNTGFGFRSTFTVDRLPLEACPSDYVVLQVNAMSSEVGTMSNAMFTVRLPDELKAELELLAKATNRSKSYLATKAIADYLQRNAWQIKELQLALQEAEKGEFVSEEAVDAWLDSWGMENELAPPLVDVVTKKR